MDGVDNPPFLKRMRTRLVNTLVDASYIVPQRLWKVALRLPRPKPRNDQVFFIGATNVPLDVLDPALTRAGRMGRQVQFRIPNKVDRADVLDFYLAKVAHTPDLDAPEAPRRARAHDRPATRRRRSSRSARSRSWRPTTTAARSSTAPTS